MVRCGPWSAVYIGNCVKVGGCYASRRSSRPKSLCNDLLNVGSDSSGGSAHAAVFDSLQADFEMLHDVLLSEVEIARFRMVSILEHPSTLVRAKSEIEVSDWLCMELLH